MFLPKVSQEYFPLGGGLDLVTPHIALKPGKLFDAQNYEPEISGGYARIAGYERFSGTTSPSISDYWLLDYTVTGTGTLLVDHGLTVVSEGVTTYPAVLALVSNSQVVISRVTTPITVGATIYIGAELVGIASSGSQLNGASSPELDADYRLFAANDKRNSISTVQGQRPIRGICVYKDDVYAFRDTHPSSGGAMWKSTAGGWLQILFKHEFLFASGTASPVVGQTIKGATSGATGVVKAVVRRDGAWAGTAVGSIVYDSVLGTFASGEIIKDSTLTTPYCTTTTAGAAITRLPGGVVDGNNRMPGQVEYCVYSFNGSSSSSKMYGCDGVNPAFEFDGTTYVPIHTGMAADAPTHLVAHRNYLFISFGGSVQYSGIADPYAWTAILGAGEIALGDDVTGFLPQGASANGSSMAIFTANNTHILYGSSSIDFQLTTSTYSIGYRAYTMQPVSNNTYGLTPRGIQSLVTTLAYGDFDYEAVSYPIQPLIHSKRGMETCSTAMRARDQYRLFFNDGTGVSLGLTGDKVSGILPLNYGKVVRCITTATLSTGIEVTYFGSDDGFVYQDGAGTSFDGDPIEAWIRPAFNHSKTPRTRKRYRRAVMEIKPYGFSKISISYDLGYANPDVVAPIGQNNNVIHGGGYWDQFTWDQFTWDTKTYAEISMSLNGTEKNISFLFYSNRAQDARHIIEGLTLHYTLQRTER